MIAAGTVDAPEARGGGRRRLLGTDLTLLLPAEQAEKIELAEIRIVSAVDREDLKGKTIEIGGPQQLSYNQIMSVVARTMGLRRLRVHIPVWLIYPATAVLQRIQPRPPATTDQLRMLAIRNVAEPGVVEQTFGFTPRTLEGNIEYVKNVGFGDGLRVVAGAMPRRIRDH